MGRKEALLIHRLDSEPKEKTWAKISEAMENPKKALMHRSLYEKMSISTTNLHQIKRENGFYLNCISFSIKSTPLISFSATATKIVQAQQLYFLLKTRKNKITILYKSKPSDKEKKNTINNVY